MLSFETKAVENQILGERFSESLLSPSITIQIGLKQVKWCVICKTEVQIEIRYPSVNETMPQFLHVKIIVFVILFLILTEAATAGVL